MTMQTRLTDPHSPQYHTSGIDLTRMITAEVEALLHLQADLEREELLLVMRDAERDGRLD